MLLRLRPKKYPSYFATALLACIIAILKIDEFLTLFEVINLRWRLSFQLGLFRARSLTVTATGGDGMSDAQAVPKGLAFHPCAPGLIASRGLRRISLCDLTRPQAPCLSVGGSVAFEGVSGQKLKF